MRMVLDTNVLVSALIKPGGLPDLLIERWEAEELTVITSTEQVDELERVLSYEKLKRFIRAEQVARLTTNLRSVAELVHDLPSIDASTDESDNSILATAIAGKADCLVTGDKAHLLGLGRVQGVQIVTVRRAIEMLDS
jgi:putative PIN family toxin of toxin-antitoxin system